MTKHLSVTKNLLCTCLIDNAVREIRQKAPRGTWLIFVNKLKARFAGGGWVLHCTIVEVSGCRDLQHAGRILINCVVAACTANHRGQPPLDACAKPTPPPKQFLDFAACLHLNETSSNAVRATQSRPKTDKCTFNSPETLFWTHVVRGAFKVYVFLALKNKFDMEFFLDFFRTQRQHNRQHGTTVVNFFGNQIITLSAFLRPTSGRSQQTQWGANAKL